MTRRGGSVLLAVAVLGAAVLATALSAAGAPDFYEDRCEYVEAGPPGPRGNRLVAVKEYGMFWIERRGDRIVLRHLEVPCRGRKATVHNVDRILLRGDGEAVGIDESSGPFAPGATRERGASEIEIRADVGKLEWLGGKGRDAVATQTLRRGRIGLQLNGAADGAARDYDVILPDPPRVLKLLGGSGADRISTRGLTNMGDNGLSRVIRLFGEQGDDTIFGGPRDEWRLEDGPGDDFVHAGGGNDEVSMGVGHDTVYGGRGDDALFYSAWERFGGTPPDVSDRLYGGPGDDQLSDYNRHPDLLDCGPGFDRAQREKHDRPRPDCEKQPR